MSLDPIDATPVTPGTLVVASVAELGPILAAMRRERGWTTARAAAESGVCAAMVSCCETGARIPHVPKLLWLLDAYGYHLAAVKR